MVKDKHQAYKTPGLKDNLKFLTAAAANGIEVTPDILGFAEDLIRLCSAEARRSQDWNDQMQIQVNIDQCILCEFDLPKEKK